MREKRCVARWISMVVVCMLVLSGCGTEEADNESQHIMMSGKEESGRYKVSEINVPDPLDPQNKDGSDYQGEDFEGFVNDLQGKPALYYHTFTLEGEEYFASVTRWALSDTNEWKVEELCENSMSEFLNQKYEQVVLWKWFRIEKFRRGDDGSLYALFTYCIPDTVQEGETTTELETYKYSVLQIDEDNDQIFEIPLSDFDYSEEVRFRMDNDVPLGRDFTDYHVFEDGRILFLYTESGGEYGKIVDGETGQTMEELGNIVNGRRRFAFGESEIIFFSGENKQFRVLAIPDLKEDNTFGSTLSDDVSGKEWCYGMNPDTWELFLCNETGIYSAVSYLDSDEVECLTANTDLSALDPVVAGEANIKDFLVGENNDFYVCLMSTTESAGGVDENSYEIVHYEKEQ